MLSRHQQQQAAATAFISLPAPPRCRCRCPQALSQAELQRVLTEPRNALVRQYARIFAKTGTAFRVTPAGCAAVAAEARGKGVGARGLRSILERLLLDAMFHAPEAEVEGVILHASAEDGDAAGAPTVTICRGHGSWALRLQEIGEGGAAAAPAAAAAQPLPPHVEAEAKAATVS